MLSVMPCPAKISVIFPIAITLFPADFIASRSVSFGGKREKS